jgi:hypothetical protein
MPTILSKNDFKIDHNEISNIKRYITGMILQDFESTWVGKERYFKASSENVK